MEYSVLLLLLLNKSWFPVVYCYTSHPGCRLSQNLPTPRLMSSREVQDREEFTPFLIPANLYHNIGGPGFELPGIIGRSGCPLGHCRCPKSPINSILGVRNQPDLGSNPDQVGGTRFGKIYIFSPAAAFLIFLFQIAGQPCRNSPKFEKQREAKGRYCE